MKMEIKNVIFREKYL
jgi:hypothetical protein